MTTFGQRGVSVVSISHRRDGYYLTLIEGPSPILVKGRAVGAQPVLLEHRDMVNLAGVEIEFLLQGQ